MMGGRDRHMGGEKGGKNRGREKMKEAAREFFSLV
jgi:hypothetical protein